MIYQDNRSPVCFEQAEDGVPKELVGLLICPSSDLIVLLCDAFGFLEDRRKIAVSLGSTEVKMRLRPLAGAERLNHQIEPNRENVGKGPRPSCDATQSHTQIVRAYRDPWSESSPKLLKNREISFRQAIVSMTLKNKVIEEEYYRMAELVSTQISSRLLGGDRL